ncbi:MAG: hypothetical protein M0R17_00030 [Candidatus Omnitrophica bacterium]|jgi:hypothetical protein|nr:hypothetical protein [Candidatus Omnitrophota bacterium]
MPTPKYLFTTYTSAQDALNSIDTWLVNTMGYTRNLAPTADTVTYTGYKAHYQFTFITGEVIYLNFHTDTVNSKLYLTTSRAYSSSLEWNVQSGTPKVQSGAVIYGTIVIPTTTTNNSLYLFGDASGNCQVFVQRGNNISASDLMQWGVLNKSGFGVWTGGCYFDSWLLPSTILSSSNSGPCIINATNQHSPYGAVDVSVDGLTDWGAIYILGGRGQQEYEPDNPLRTTSTYYSSIVVGLNLTTNTNLLVSDMTDGSTYYCPNQLCNVVEDFASGYVNNMTGRIVFGQNTTIYVRHEATQRISPIGCIPFGYHCPIAGAYQYVAPGTQLVQDDRTFIMIGNIAAEMVSV